MGPAGSEGYFYAANTSKDIYWVTLNTIFDTQGTESLEQIFNKTIIFFKRSICGNLDLI